MFRSLRAQFLLVLLAVVLVGLSATFLLRELMVRDFGGYLEGEMEDRVYWVTAALESSYERNGMWNPQEVIDHTIWALMLGVEVRLFDSDGMLVIDSEAAVNSLSPLVNKRVLALSHWRSVDVPPEYTPYAMFLRGQQIGVLETFVLPIPKGAVFVSRSNRFLVFSVLALGGVALVLSILLASWLSRPIKDLTTAAAGISEGDLESRVEATRSDEIGSLSAAFNRMADSLLLQESLRRKLTANMAHELRTPLSAIKGEIEGMLDGLIASDKENLQSIYDEIGRLRTILDGIEDLSQAEASSLSLSKRTVALEPFLQNIVERFGKVFNEEGVSLEMSCEPGLSADVDPDKLSQVVINLLSNALKATGSGGSVRISAASGDGEAVLEVSDTGAGIPEKDIPYVFERFYRASSGGLGIGLTIVKELVQAHSGQVSVRSTRGEGSVFTVRLPA